MSINLISILLTAFVGPVVSTCIENCSDSIKKNANGLLNPAERAQFNELLGRSHSYIEWGSGLSTHLSLVHPNGPKIIHSIENQEQWCNLMKSRGDISCMRHCLKSEDVHFRMHCVNDGAQHAGYHYDYKLENHAAGYNWNDSPPVEDIVLAREFGYHYVRLPATIVSSSELKHVDLFLVDGRWRNACLLQAWLLSGTNSTVLLHDSDRKEYQDALKYFSVVGKAGSLILLMSTHTEDKSIRELVWTNLLAALSVPH